MSKIDKIGIGLMVIGFLIPFFVLFGFIIGFPIYIVGAILLLFGKLKIKHKLLWILVPLILFYPSYNLASSISLYYSDKQKVDLILPSDFSGKVIIIDNIDFGQSFEKKHKREQIIFDKNGIAFYPKKLELDKSNYRVYLKDVNGKLRQINWFYKSSEKITINEYGESIFEIKTDSTRKYILYNYLAIGNESIKHTESKEKCKLIELIKKGELKTVYNKMYN
ncbi:hypothetical protein [Tenacibaculum sp. nBUS_03]|uniref:hypothetical protein n=1 Tax=Tenacibaculum sp. nBUS_03 TaxID=3395320 RepID=UPI003EB7CA1E